MSTPSTAPKPFSLSLSSKPPKPSAKRPSTLTPSVSTTGSNQKKRARLDEDSDASDNEEDGRTHKSSKTTAAERSGFGAVIKKEEKLVIPRLGNRDWRKVAEAVRAGRGMGGKAGAGGQGEEEGTMEVGNQEKTQWGLVISEPAAAVGAEEPQAEEAQKGDKAEENDKLEETEEQRAIRAILDPSARSSSLDITIPQANEELAFKRDYERLPSPPSLASYAAIPVEEFGKAMLRGMGWVEGKDSSTKGKEIKKRPALLGLGAKEGGILGDEDKKGKKRRRPDMEYTPVMRVDKQGNRVDEQGRRIGEDGRPIEEKSLVVVERERTRDRSRDRDRDGGRDRSRDRERDRDRDRHRSKRDRDDDRDRRDKDRTRDRERDGDRDRERDRDRDRSRDRKRDRDGHRDRSRERDRDRDRDRRRDRSRDRARDGDRDRDRDRDRRHRR